MARAKSATVDLKVRMKEPLRAKIEAAARARGVSLNAEAVDRLKWSFVEEDYRFEEFGGPGGYGIFRVLGGAAAALGDATGGVAWWRNPGLCMGVTNLTSNLLDQLLQAIAKIQQWSSRDILSGPPATVRCHLRMELAEKADDGTIGEFRQIFDNSTTFNV